MNIAELSIRKQVITLTLTVLMVVGGIQSYMNLSRLEDPEFTIKNAVIYTTYPGATAREVEEEVTDTIERAVQELGQLDLVESKSMRGLSIVNVTIKDKYDKTTLPQVWDELRRKVGDYQRQLPPGASASLVNDDFGDVYGVYYALTGEGYSYAELRDTADMLRRELLLVQDVKRVVFYGDRQEAIFVEMSREKMAALGIDQQSIYSALADKNLVANAGYVKSGSEYIPINPGGEFLSEKQFGDLLISARGSDKLVFLRDVAQIRRGYVDPRTNILRFNGQVALGIGISCVLGGNVVTMGNALEKRLAELDAEIPLGMELQPICMQSETVTQAVNGFLVNLAGAVVIVVVVLLFFMGARSGLIIGFILLQTICGTFIVMDLMSVTLERISLGALIIALGMLVDNAIVVTEGMQIKIEAGIDRIKAAGEVVGQTAVPLLGATVVAILAFASIGVSQDSTGEFCRTLFQVILISLSLSWVTAVTTTPLLCKMILKGGNGGQEAGGDPYGGLIFRLYRSGLTAAIRFRWVTVAVVIAMFAVSMIGFKSVKRSFFPASTSPQFTIDVWLPEGTHIDDTETTLVKAEQYLRGLEGMLEVATTVGGGNLRFMLTYAPEFPSSSYGQFIVKVDDYRKIDGLVTQIEDHFAQTMPEAIVGAKKLILGPGDGGKIQMRLSGPDHAEVRRLADVVKRIIEEDGGAKTIRDEWREQVKVFRPQLSEAVSRRTGITRPILAATLRESWSGYTTGVYREGDDLIPIIARAPEEERGGVDDLKHANIFSPATGRMIPISQVVSGFETDYEDAAIWRRDRMPMLRIHCDPRVGLAADVVKRIKPKIEQALGVDVAAVTGAGIDSAAHTDTTLPISYKAAWPLKGKPGFTFAWDGEAENGAKANASLGKTLPVFGLFMVLIVIFLFNAFKQPLIIWLCVPLAMIGVASGLLIADQPFGFMSLLGLLSLSGMLIKNAIVLIDQIDFEIEAGKAPLQAVIDSGVSRLRPVAMAAATTILGMAPLLTDAFFVAMAVTIMFGLGFATILTLVVVPVFYVILFKIEYRKPT
ncbi:MAG: efflux RND transporter permease subunit [Acidobacteriota bacterium]|nr:efflux RND transporter permease subunit [Acidobacteriota bacterium]